MKINRKVSMGYQESNKKVSFLLIEEVTEDVVALKHDEPGIYPRIHCGRR